MISRKLIKVCSRLRGPAYICSNYCTENDNLKTICKYLNIDEAEGKYLQMKYPVIKKLDEEKFKYLVQTLFELGFPSKIILEEPSFCGLLPITLKYRYKVLQECGIENVNAKHLVSYLNIIRQKSICDLRKLGLISKIINVENRLASYLTQWPTSLTTLVYGDVENYTLYSLRIKILQRYLELMLDLTQDEFKRGLNTYPTMKHRPLGSISLTLEILQREISIPNYKIKSNLYLIHADPENLRQILYKFKTIGGIDIKEIIRMYPKLAVKNYKTLIKTRTLLEEYGLSPEAQIRCFNLFSLSPDTIRKRLENAKDIPEINTFYKHPRFLKMILYSNTVNERLLKLYSNNKKCLSLNILSGSSAHYEVFEKAPGDRLGKGKDLVFCICQSLGKPFNPNQVRNILKRHPFWINIPLIQVKYVYDQLSLQYSSKEIYENCPILLYPWNKIRETMCLLNKTSDKSPFLVFHDQIDITKLSKSQRLSLILYLLERNHYFTGNGVWTDEKQRKSEVSSSETPAVAMVQ